jgi:hypothetical protein
MDVNSALTELESIAAKLNVQVIYDNLVGEGMGPGGLCKVKGQWRVIIERRSSPSERLSILIRALSRFDLENHYLSPMLRELIERVAAKNKSANKDSSPREYTKIEAREEANINIEESLSANPPSE